MPVTPRMPSRVMNKLSSVFPLRTSVISEGVHRDLPVKLHRPEQFVKYSPKGLFGGLFRVIEFTLVPIKFRWIPAKSN